MQDTTQPGLPESKTTSDHSLDDKDKYLLIFCDPSSHTDPRVQDPRVLAFEAEDLEPSAQDDVYVLWSVTKDGKLRFAAPSPAKLLRRRLSDVRIATLQGQQPNYKERNKLRNQLKATQALIRGAEYAMYYILHHRKDLVHPKFPKVAAEELARLDASYRCGEHTYVSDPPQTTLALAQERTRDNEPPLSRAAAWRRKGKVNGKHRDSSV